MSVLLLRRVESSEELPNGMGAGSPLAEESRQESVTYATCTQLAGQPIKSCRKYSRRGVFRFSKARWLGETVVGSSAKSGGERCEGASSVVRSRKIEGKLYVEDRKEERKKKWEGSSFMRTVGHREWG
jgi:hypothetical protein